MNRPPQTHVFLQFKSTTLSPGLADELASYILHLEENNRVSHRYFYYLVALIFVRVCVDIAQATGVL